MGSRGVCGRSAAGRPSRAGAGARREGDAAGKGVGPEAGLIQAEAVALAAAAQQGEEAAAVGVAGEDGLAVVAAIEDVGAGFLRPLLATWGTGHQQSLRVKSPLPARPRGHYRRKAEHVKPFRRASLRQAKLGRGGEM